MSLLCPSWKGLLSRLSESPVPGVRGRPPNLHFSLSPLHPTPTPPPRPFHRALRPQPPYTGPPSHWNLPYILFPPLFSHAQIHRTALLAAISPLQHLFRACQPHPITFRGKDPPQPTK